MADDNSFVERGAVECHLYQCSGCRYTSPLKHHVTRHLEAKCPTARVLNKRCVLTFDLGSPAPPAAVQQHVTQGDHCTSNITNNNISVQPVFYVGSEEERAALFRLLTEPDTLKELGACPAQEIPATLFRLWKGADAPGQLKNIVVKGDKIEERRGPDCVVSVARTKFLKTAVGNMMSAVETVDDTELHKELTEPVFGCGKRRSVSRADAAKMSAVGSHEVYKLDTGGREFLKKSHACLDKELDYYHDAAAGVR